MEETCTMGKPKNGKLTEPRSLRPWIPVLLSILFITIVRIRLLRVPLERDEGEFAYMGQLMLHGIPPYKLAYNLKFPGIYAAYAAIMALFGQSIMGIHLGLLCVNVAAIIILFLLVRRLYDPFTGAVAAVSYTLLSVGQGILGFAGHATHFVMVFALGGLLLLLKARDSNRPKLLLWSGILLGIATLMKQPGVFFAVFAGFYLLWTELRSRPVKLRSCAAGLALLIAGVALPLVITFIAMWAAGVFPRFWFWTVDYAKVYGSGIPLSMAPSIFWDSFAPIVSPSFMLWILGAVGLFAPLWDKQSRSRAAFTYGLLIFSFAAICPGLCFRGHYFVQVLPVVALLIGIATSALHRLIYNKNLPILWRVVPVALFCVALFVSVMQQEAYLFEMSSNKISRVCYGANPFPESIEIAKYIRQHTTPSDTIAIFGSEPQIFFYSGRHSATGYIYAYSVTDPGKYTPRMQREMIEEIQSARPKYAIFVALTSSWVATPHPNTKMVKWSQAYIGKYYHRVGIVSVDMEDSALTSYTWGKESEYVEDPDCPVIIFERN